MGKLYIIGLCILLVAILANAIIVKIGILSWYDFLSLLNEHGSNGLKRIGIIDYLWLFVGYPFILSLGYLVGAKIFTIIFN
ncbi:MAG: hypothetical protein HKO80_01600 [Flavobacteriaceae bacterium]|nr:hypothetical protein [Flavobacteriaceae bacterium]